MTEEKLGEKIAETIAKEAPKGKEFIVCKNPNIWHFNEHTQEEFKPFKKLITRYLEYLQEKHEDDGISLFFSWHETEMPDGNWLRALNIVM
jgi:hypothetical protein